MERGKYLYCVAEGGVTTSLGRIGIDGHEVYAVPHRDICAVVHDCLAEPYQSTDAAVVKAWVLTHQKVVDMAWERWGTVLPFGFNTIAEGNAQAKPQPGIINWLQEDYERLKMRMEKVRGKAEYGVQVFWEPAVIARMLAAASPELRELEGEIKTMPRGLAYMYRQKLEKALQREMEYQADRCFRDYSQRIRGCVDDIVVEKNKVGEQDAPMIMNLSCLLAPEKSVALGEELEGINKATGFAVRFTGPWPPYSFVGA